jgi:hypothetical protein
MTVRMRHWPARLLIGVAAALLVALGLDGADVAVETATAVVALLVLFVCLDLPRWCAGAVAAAWVFLTLLVPNDGDLTPDAGDLSRLGVLVAVALVAAAGLAESEQSSGDHQGSRVARQGVGRLRLRGTSGS